MLDRDRTGLHAHEIAALAGGALVADRQPAHLRLHRTFEIVRLEGGIVDVENATSADRSSHCACSSLPATLNAPLPRRKRDRAFVTPANRRVILTLTMR